MNDLPEEPKSPPADEGPAGPAGDRQAAVSPDAAEAGSGEGAGARSRRRRRSRHKRGGASETVHGESAEGSVEQAPVAPAVIDPAVREGAQQLFGEVVSGAYDELVDDPAQAPAQGLWADDSAPEAQEPAAPVDGGSPERVGSTSSEDMPNDGSAGPDDGLHRRVLAPDPDAPKLHKVLAQSGVGSRRDLEAMIEAGRVTVNGEVAHTGQRVSHGDRIQIDGKPVRIRMRPGKPRVIAYHKSVGEVVTHDDPQQRPTVFRRLPRLVQGKWQSVGRLDLNTEGLLLFTNSGELANQLMHPRFGVEREYAVRVLGRLDDQAQARLLEGVEIEGQKAAFISIEDGGGEGVNHWYRVVLNEGRNREVRRLFDSVGLTVSRLIRIRYGCVVLPRGLKRGAWVDLSERDVDQLGQLAGMRPRGPERGRSRGNGGPAKTADGPPGKSGRGRDRGAEKPRRERGEDGPIPSPLLQTYDKRAFKEEQRRPRREYGEDGPIPNPLQQTFDQRALKEAQRRPKRDYGEDGPIPNPLQQTYDKRALHSERRADFGDDLPEDEGPIPNPLQQTFDKRFAGKATGGGGRGGRGRAGGGGRGKAAGGAGEPGGPARSGGAGRGKGKPGGTGAAGSGGGSRGAKTKGAGQGRGKGPAQPDPMRTAVGYIGADAALGRSGKSGRGRRGR